MRGGATTRDFAPAGPGTPLRLLHGRGDGDLHPGHRFEWRGLQLTISVSESKSLSDTTLFRVLFRVVARRELMTSKRRMEDANFHEIALSRCSGGCWYRGAPRLSRSRTCRVVPSTLTNAGGSVTLTFSLTPDANGLTGTRLRHRSRPRLGLPSPRRRIRLCLLVVVGANPSDRPRLSTALILTALQPGHL